MIRRSNALLLNGVLACASAGAPTYPLIASTVSVQDDWAIHVPLSKVKTERMVPMDAFVCRLIDRLRVLRSPDPLPADGFLLARPSGRNVLIPGCALSGETTSPRPGSLRELSPINCDINSEQRCFALALLCRCNEVARTPQSRDDHALSGESPRWTYNVSFIWLPSRPAISYPHPGSRSRPVPTGRPRLSAQEPSLSRSTSSENVPCVEPFPRVQIVVCSTTSTQSTHHDHFRKPRKLATG